MDKNANKNKDTKKKTTGMLLGKFMPPHMGHIFLAQFAQNYVDELTIVVGSLKDEPIPGEIRYQWMKEMFPNANVVHLTDENPQLPEEHPDFWQIWHDSLMRVLPSKPDFVFAGEDYGAPLAETLGAAFIPCNQGRSIIGTSGTDIRNDPMGNWDQIPDVVKPYFAKRICIMGPESTGKSTLAQKLAKRFDTHAVPEYAYSYIKHKGLDNLELNDMDIIAKAQKASEDALAKQANKLLFCDTSSYTTKLWSEYIFGVASTNVEKQAMDENYDLYLLMDYDTPFVEDVHRVDQNSRKAFMEKCEAYLKSQGKNYIKISGSWAERYAKAETACENLMKPAQSTLQQLHKKAAKPNAPKS